MATHLLVREDVAANLALATLNEVDVGLHAILQGVNNERGMSKTALAPTLQPERAAHLCEALGEEIRNVGVGVKAGELRREQTGRG